MVFASLALYQVFICAHLAVATHLTGKPEPTALPPPKQRAAYAPASGNRAMSSVSSHSAGGSSGGDDPNGMERLTGETDAQYIARPTRLRDEAKARMAAKFGGGGMGGVGSGGGMGGIGSDPNYNPNSGYGGGGDFDVNALGSSVMTGLGSAFGALSTAASSGIAMVQDEGTKRQLVDVTSSVASTAGSFWGGLSAGASNLVSSVTQPDDPGSDGLADLQAQFHSQVNPNSKYSGFGSESAMGNKGSSHSSNGMGGMGSMGAMGGAAPAPAAPSMPTSTSTLTEAMPGPGEDPNGIERLSGESDEQYVMRQTRLRDEAKARMAAKFGGGGMGGVGSNSSAAPSSGNFGGIGSNSMSAPSSGNSSVRPPAPASGGLNMTPQKVAPKVTSGDDFFANFGT